ncbi:phage baseplate assembly protein [Amphritea sp. HPY]|uniref:phage baseplate assembly protein n=1 Tax=Amphritea sp. HPY TaxID=3421652 RepID=UPI003D7D93FA
MSDVRLYVNGAIYDGWKEVTVTRSIEQAAPTFSIGLSSYFDGGNRVLPVSPGSSCKLELNNELVITGHVDGVQGSYGVKQHNYSIAGRSAIGDLVDCTAIIAGGEFKDQTVAAIASVLCKPFGIKAVVESGVDVGAPLSKHRSDDGSVHEVIERACRRRGLLLTSSAEGDLVITTVGSGSISTPLVSGENIKKGSGKFSQHERFSEYRVKGQVDDGGQGWELEQQVQALGVAKDPNVKRYRPLVIDAEEGDTDLSKRAQFEATTRLGRSVQVTYSVQGWEHDGGLWEPNKLVRVVDYYFDIDGWFLISKVVYRYGKGGTEADITVVPKEAFSLQVLKEKSSSSSGWENINVYD